MEEKYETSVCETCPYAEEQEMDGYFYIGCNMGICYLADLEDEGWE